MIRFTLRCGADHRFEGWFASSEAFEAQRAGATVECPLCGSNDVEKALMAPAVSTSRKRVAAAPPSGEVAAANADDAPGPAQQLAAHVPDHAQAIAALRQLRQQVTANADYVGNRFSAEARRIHFGEAEKRGIYGEASLQDVKALAEDGIECHPLPVLPEDRN